MVVEDIPQGAESMALVGEYPDAPGRTFDQWVVCEMPIASGLAEGATHGAQSVTIFKKSGL